MNRLPSPPRLAALAALVLLTLPTAAPASDAPTGNLVETLVEAGHFDTLVDLVTIAGLADVVADARALTILAPTDDAFAALPQETVEALLADPEGALTPILLYHVLPGRNSPNKLRRRTVSETVAGGGIVVRRERRTTWVNQARISGRGYRATNGVALPIDSVLIPPAIEDVETIPDVLAVAGSFQTLLTAVSAAGLGEALSTDDELTLLAPTDAAFAKLPPSLLEALLADPEALSDVLLYHVVPGAEYSLDLLEAGQVESLLGDAISVGAKRRQILFNDTVRLLSSNLHTPNGSLIHVIDAVLVP